MTYGTILADPPWPYDTATSGHRALPTNLVKDGSRLQISVAEWTYPAMSLVDIESLPVDDLASRDACLFLWTTNSFLREGLDVMDAWGFTYKTTITWVKTKKDDPDTPSMKQGWWFRGATEHCLFGVRGKVRRQSTTAHPTALLLPRIRQHSRKPDELYPVIEEMCPGPYLEMFARRPREGWDSWGNQLVESIDLEEVS